MNTKSLVTSVMVACAVAAQAQPQRVQPPQEGASALRCVTSAAQFHGVNPDVLAAILVHESRGKAHTVARNSNNTLDVGLGGINSIHFTEFAKYGIQPWHLLDGCVNTYAAAYLLKKKLDAYGNTWFAVGAYHSTTPQNNEAYVRKIQMVLRRNGVLR